MVMEKWILPLLVLACISICNAESFEFVYQERNETENEPYTIVSTGITLDGSHASLGEWPHWCLGNLSKCENGLTVDLWIKFTELAEVASDVIVLSSGGHMWYANGFYLLQRYGDEYEFGVAIDDLVWRVQFRVRPGLWVNIHAFWDYVNGLVLMVDGASHQNPDAENRNFQQMAFDSFMDLEFGLNVDGTPLTEHSRFEVFKLGIYDWIISFPLNDIDTDKLWLGCGALDSTDRILPVPEGTAVFSCREICTSVRMPIAVVQNKEQCACSDEQPMASLKEDRTLCSDTDWDYYSASALRENDAHYSIVVTVTKLGTKPYVKPRESVIINIDTNFLLDIPFTIDFGDGTIANVIDKRVSYYWEAAGRYDITVQAQIGLARIVGSTDFFVEDIDEGYAGDFVILETFHGDQDHFANVDFTNVDYATAACRYTYDITADNATVEEMLALEEYVETAHTTHIYKHIGRYKLHVDCVNPYGDIHNDTYFISKKLDTTFHFHDSALSFVTPYAGDSEFYDYVKVSNLDRDIPLNETNQAELEISSNSLLIQDNYIEYTFKDIELDKRIISVQNKIQKPDIFSPVIDGAWNLTTNITIRVPSGNNMFLNVSFSAGEDQIFYIHNLPHPSDIMFEIIFPVLGYYFVQANVSNDISYNTSDMLVSVEVPLRYITLQVKNITDKEEPVELLIDLNDGVRGPMKINFQIDQGNGYVDTYHDYSDQFFFPTYHHYYIYPDWGIYEICVRAFNRISSIIECITVQVGQRIRYVDITMPSAGRFVPDETALAIIRCPKGSDKTYIVDFEDETFVFTDRYLKETEHFEETTTTTSTTMSTAAQTTMAENTTSVNANSSSDANNTTSLQSLSNSTGDYNETDSTTAMYNTTTEEVLERRRREVNGSDYENSTSSMNSTSMPATIQTTFDNSTYSPVMVTEMSSNGTSDWNTNGTDYSTNATNASNATNANATTGTGNGNGRPQTTTTQAPTTTSMIITSTMAPIPDDASTPYTSNTTFARRLRDGTIEITHRFQTTGVYSVNVQVANHFNWARDELCPDVIVANETVSDPPCRQSELDIPVKYLSTAETPLQYYRSEQINLTATVKMTGCGKADAEYSWRTQKIVTENGRLIRRPYHDTGICVQQNTEKIFKYPRSSLPFGSYVVTLVVSPAGHPLVYSEHEFFMDVSPSHPHAVIDGNDEHLWFLVYGTTMLKFQKSIDPDFNIPAGIEYDLVFMPESDFSEDFLTSTSNLVNKSSLVASGITHKYTSKNPVRMYEYKPCFQGGANLTQDLRFPNGEFNLPSEYFLSEVNSFAMILYVTKNKLRSSAYVTFEIRLSNSSNLLDQLDDLLKSKDTTGVMRAVTALTASMVTTSGNASEEEEFEAKEAMTELKSKLIGALDSVSEGVKDIDQAGGMISLVDDLTKDSGSVSESARVGATSAIKNSATVTESFAEEPLDKLTDVGSKVVSGVSNVLPKEDEIAKKLAEHEKSLALAENDAKAATSNGDEEEEEVTPENEPADIIFEEETDELTELTEDDVASNDPLPYNKLLKKCDLLHSPPLDKLYKYIFFYESIFRVILKNKSEEIMVDAEILKMRRNDIFCYIGILEEPGDVEWYYNRYFDEEKRRRDLIRKNADRDVSKSFLGSIDSVASVVLGKSEPNQTVEMGGQGLKVAMKKVSPNATDEDDAVGDGGGVKMPMGLIAANGNDSDIGQTLILNEQSPFTYGNENDTTEVGTGVVTFKLSTPGTKDEVPVSNTTEPIEIYLAGNPDKVQEPMLNTIIWTKGEAESSMNYHAINVTKNDTTIHIIVRPQFADSEDLFDVLIQYEDRPNETHYIDMVTLPLPEESIAPNLTWEKTDVLRHTFFPDAELTKRAGLYKVGVKLRSAVFDLQLEEAIFNYTWQMFLGGCRFWNHENETWDSDGCIVGNLTTFNATQCLCTHLTSFGGEMVVPPNTIDFNNVWAKFKDLNENAAVFSVIISLLGLYVIGLIWARYMDKKDIVKWGASPLEDNLPTDTYHYQISVYTGTKKNSGTKSNISFIISGEVTDTGVRRMFDGKRKSHGTGSIMNYIVSVENKLGPISFCRVWHDNSGEGKDRSWFLDQIEMTDLQTGERYFFLCNRWLACEEDDGMVDRILPVAGIEDLVAFKQLFSSSVRKKLTSDHLWLSVFSRPTRSSFTRVQRISCCMNLLFLTMITNAMWFKSDGDAKDTTNVVSLKIGPITFTLQQIFISLMSTLIVFPPSFLLITLFRRTKKKKNTITQSNLRQPKRGKWKNLGTNSRASMWSGSEPKTSRFKKFKESIQELVKGNNKSKYAEDEEELDNAPVPTIAGDPNAKKNADKQKKKKKPFMFPHWCSYIAWILCFFSIITPAFFTILYSMEWGKDKANEWLITFVMSFFQSVIVVQPIKVLCLVTFIACVLKKPDLDEEGDCTDELRNAIAKYDEEVSAKGAAAIDEIASRRRNANETMEPPDTAKLEEQRQTRMREMKMEAILKEIMVYGFFVLILFFLSYQQRDLQSYYYTDNMKNMFLGKFHSISTTLDYWVWLDKFFLPTLYAAKFHNGTELVKWWDKRCLNDYQSRRMGIARMRQFRIKEDSCKIMSTMRPVINHCRNDYNWLDDDTKAYLPNWQETSEENRTILDKRRDDPFVYQNSVRLKSAPYVATLQTYKGGGYVVNFERSFRRTKRNLTRLREEDWFDLRTRAVILEFTVYNPNSNLFASAVLTTEFPSYGGAIGRSEFKIFRLQSYVGGFAIVVIFFEVLYCCFTIFFFVRCIKKVKKEKCKYFKTFWDILEFAMLCFAVSCIAMYVFKHMLTKVAFHFLKKQSQPEFINFQSLAMYDEFYGYMTAIVVFLASIQFLKLLQFNKKMNMLGDTVKLATKDLKVFSIAFLLYFLAFVLTAYLLFGKYMGGYNGFVTSAESVFAFTLGAFDFHAMTDAHAFLGPVFFFTFIMVIYVGLMSIFLTIIADAFTTVKEQTQHAENEYEMVDFIWRKFKKLIGVK